MAFERVRFGRGQAGIDGFRRSHHDAIITRRMPGELRFATHRDVRLVALAAQDDEETADFARS